MSQLYRARIGNEAHPSESVSKVVFFGLGEFIGQPHIQIVPANGGT